MWRFMVIYSYPVEMKGKQRSPIVWFSKKEKSANTFGMYFSCFGPLWVRGVTPKLLGLGINRQMTSFLDMCQPAGASAGAITASTEAVYSFRWSCFNFCRNYCSFRWSCYSLCRSCCSFRWSHFWCFQLSFLSLKNYIFSPYIILISNRLVGWYLMKF